MTIGRLRTLLYKTARVLGDVNALLRGRVMQRLGRRVVGSFSGRLIGKLFR